MFLNLGIGTVSEVYRKMFYLLFDLDNSVYGVEAALVQEVFFLPELAPIAEAPRDIVGLVNLRGQILPVMDLRLRFGYRRHRYRLSDSVVVVVWRGTRVGIVVNQVREVCEIEGSNVATDLSYGRDTPADRRFVTGVATRGTQTIALLDCDRLIRYSETVQISDDDDREDSIPDEPGELPLFCPDATPEERQIFRDRAENLLQSMQQDDNRDRLSLAVVGLAGEYFGVDLHVVREFADIRKITPVPCTPAHIIGNTNLRGEILTLVAIRSLLGLSTTVATSVSKAIVVEVGEIVAGITVDEVFDVVRVHPSQIGSVPAAVRSSAEEYLRGTAPYKEKTMSILDLEKILTKGELVVDRAV